MIELVKWKMTAVVVIIVVVFVMIDCYLRFSMMMGKYLVTELEAHSE